MSGRFGAPVGLSSEGAVLGAVLPEGGAFLLESDELVDVPDEVPEPSLAALVDTREECFVR